MSSDKVSKDLPSFNKYIGQLKATDAQDGKIDGRNNGEDLFGGETLDTLVEYDKKDDGEVNGSIFKDKDNKEFTDYIDKVNGTKMQADIGSSNAFPGVQTPEQNMSFASVMQYLDFLFSGGSIQGGAPVSESNAYTMLFSPEMLSKHGIKGFSEGDEYIRGANYGGIPSIKEDYTLNGGKKIFNGKAQITSPFGTRKSPMTGETQMHDGIDIGLAQGTSLKTPFDGVVKFAGQQNGYGNIVIIDHGNGKETRYAHLSEIDLKPGQKISAGQELGKSGGAVGTQGAGSSTGSHLHFEYRENGKAKDPLASGVAEYLV